MSRHDSPRDYRETRQGSTPSSPGTAWNERGLTAGRAVTPDSTEERGSKTGRGKGFFKRLSSSGGRGKNGGEEKKKAKAKRSFKRTLYEALWILVVAALVAIAIQTFFIKAFLIPSASMSPTLRVGDRVMVEKVTYYFRKPRRGDIIVFRFPPTGPGAMNTTNPFYWPFEQIGETLHLAHRGTTPYVKRVIASEGETLQLKKGKLYINGKRINEKYVVGDEGDYGPVKVPGGMLFCMGDNRPNSRDSRSWGMVPARSVIGRVFLIWWPPSRFGRPK